MPLSVTAVLPRAAFYTHHRLLLLLLGALAFLNPRPGVAQKIQDFETSAATGYAYAEPIGSAGAVLSTAVHGPAFAASGTHSYGVYNDTGNEPVSGALNFERVQLNASVTNTLSFDLSVVALTAAGGLDARGSIQVNIGYNGGDPNNGPVKQNALIVAGRLDKPTWPFAATGTAVAAIASTAQPAMYYPAVDGASGYGKVSITFLPTGGITAIDVQIVLNASSQTAVLVDNVAVSSAGPLPVELTSFEAVAQGNGVGVRWATASETNCDRFEVQRSAAGAAFETVGVVKGQGNSAAHRYSFADGRPLAGRSYYRLRQVDANGAAVFSPVATVWSTPAPRPALPNPCAGALTLPPAPGPVRYRVLNAVGQTLASGRAEGNERLDLSALPVGPFWLELTDANGRTLQRLVRE